MSFDVIVRGGRSIPVAEKKLLSTGNPMVVVKFLG